MAAVMRSALAPDPFHSGEMAMQKLAGLREEAEAAAPFIRAFMPDQHRAFWPLLPTFFVGTVDGAGRPWASVLAGRPGFMQAPDPLHLRISARPAFGDPITLGPGRHLGGLGLEQHTRRRNRLNGTVQSWDAAAGSLDLAVDQSFGNCPRYITARTIMLDEAALRNVGKPRPVQRGAALGPQQRAFAASASTFFIATCAVDCAGPAMAKGCDVSHRGGMPGFVHVAADGQSLLWPDWHGNNLFNTLGNLQINPKAGLLFVDFATGDTLQMTGEAEVSMDTQGWPGAQRSLTFRVHEFVQIAGAVPVRMRGAEEYSPYNPRSAAAAATQTQQVECVSRRLEAQDIVTFEFRAPLGLSYEPGMYASFDLEGLEGEGVVTNRTWTVSSHPDETAARGTFTISVKRQRFASAWLHDNVAPGTALALRGIQGAFTPQPTSKPMLLVAAGIGITPMRAMFHDALKRGVDVVLVYSVRSAAEAAFLDELSGKAAAAPAGTARLLVSVTSAGGGAGGGGTGRAAASGKSPAVSWARGRVTAASLAAAAPDVARRDLYVCGPAPFMNAVIEGAQSLGLPADRVPGELQLLMAVGGLVIKVGVLANKVCDR